MIRSNQSRLTAARTRLLLDYPWFGSLSMRLRLEEDSTIPTFATDGTRIKYNPEFLDKVSDPELTAILAHGVMHCALLHPYRRGNRDPKLWNIATDHAINNELKKAGLSLPADCVCDQQYDGLSAEVIYAQLGKENHNPDQNSAQHSGSGDQDNAGDDSSGSGDVPSTGAVQDAPTGSESQDSGEMSESDWKVAAEQASDVARGCGKLPGSAAERVKASRTAPADWRELLREFVTHTVPSDYSWLSPNRRFISDGLYLPGVVKENLGHIAVAVDTSGSIDQKLLAAFCTELNSIVNEARADGVTVLYCDSQVNKTEEFAQDEEIVLTAVGRGGTAFSPVFKTIEAWEENPVCLIYFTDLDCWDTPTAPEYPVLWATDLSVTKDGPFGQTVRITAE